MKKWQFFIFLALTVWGGSMLMAATASNTGSVMSNVNNSMVGNTHSGMMSHAGGTGMHGASGEYMQAMQGMHDDMMRGVQDPDPDAAFARGMIPHHRGAVDMAKIELKYGKDPELRKLAQTIIDAQEKEIKFMRDWLEKKGLSQ